MPGTVGEVQKIYIFISPSRLWSEDILKPITYRKHGYILKSNIL